MNLVNITVLSNCFGQNFLDNYHRLPSILRRSEPSLEYFASLRILNSDFKKELILQFMVAYVFTFLFQLIFQ